MTLSVERKTREPETIPDVWLAFAPVKRAQTDWLVEKATELGAARLIPVMTQRTIAERVRLERLESIAIEAAEQCGRTRLPEIAEPVAAQAAAHEREAGADPLFRRRGRRRAGGERIQAGPGADPGRPRGRVHRRGARADPRGAERRRRSRSARASCAPKPPRLAALAAYMAVAGDWRLRAYQRISRKCWRRYERAAKRARRMTHAHRRQASRARSKAAPTAVGVRGRREAARATGASAPSTRSSSTASPTIARRPTTSPAASATC